MASMPMAGAACAAVAASTRAKVAPAVRARDAVFMTIPFHLRLVGMPTRRTAKPSFAHAQGATGHPSVGQKHGVDDVDDAIRLHDVGDGDLGRPAFLVLQE